MFLNSIKIFEWHFYRFQKEIDEIINPRYVFGQNASVGLYAKWLLTGSMTKEIEDELQQRNLNFSLIAQFNDDMETSDSLITEKRTRFRREYLMPKTDELKIKKINNIKDCVTNYHSLKQVKTFRSLLLKKT